MNREETKAAIAVMQAWLEGKTVQCSEKAYAPNWIDVGSGALWNFFACDYRIAPEPRLRPWKLDEVPVGAAVKSKDGEDTAIILRASRWENGEGLNVMLDGITMTASCLLENWTMDDDSPCGKEE